MSTPDRPVGNRLNQNRLWGEGGGAAEMQILVLLEQIFFITVFGNNSCFRQIKRFAPSKTLRGGESARRAGGFCRPESRFRQAIFRHETTKASQPSEAARVSGGPPSLKLRRTHHPPLLAQRRMVGAAGLEPATR